MACLGHACVNVGRNSCMVCRKMARKRCIDLLRAGGQSVMRKLSLCDEARPRSQPAAALGCRAGVAGCMRRPDPCNASEPASRAWMPQAVTLPMREELTFSDVGFRTVTVLLCCLRLALPAAASAGHNAKRVRN
ncbi:unnamed protein product [Effrenium voratum]|nr:unnamed protein product [Effrenium voratum]